MKHKTHQIELLEYLAEARISSVKEMCRDIKKLSEKEVLYALNDLIYEGVVRDFGHVLELNDSKFFLKDGDLVVSRRFPKPTRILKLKSCDKHHFRFKDAVEKQRKASGYAVRRKKEVGIYFRLATIHDMKTVRCHLVDELSKKISKLKEAFDVG